MWIRLRAVVPALALLLFASGAVHAATDWPFTGHDPGATAYNASERGLTPRNVARLHVVWSYPRLINAVAAGSRIYGFTTGGSAAHLVALDANTGRVLATTTPARLHFSAQDAFNTLATDGNTLVVAGALEIVAVGTGLGTVRWHRAFGATSLMISQGTVYTGDSCQSYCGTPQGAAINLQSGRVIWTHPGNFSATPVMVSNRLYQVWDRPSGETRVYAVNDGRLLATVGLTGAWVADSGGAYIASQTRTAAHQSLSMLRPSGRLGWTLPLGSIAGPATPPVLAPSTIFAASDRFHPGVVAVSRARGQVQWGADVGAHLSLAAVPGLLFALQQNGTVAALDATNGHPLARVPAARGGTASYSGLMVAGGTVYATSSSGLVALRP